MNLSENLSYKEAIYSATAIKKDIPNSPTIQHLESLKATAKNICQPIRDHFGVAIRVTSGYRSEELNSLIGGSRTSQHSKGEALDLDAQVYSKITNEDIFDYISEHLIFDQLIWEFGDSTEPDWVHVSYKSEGENRGEELVAYKKNGRTKYKFYNKSKL